MNGKINCTISDDGDVAYVTLPEYPSVREAGIVKKTIQLREIIKDYEGADINLNFDESNTLIGVEIVTWDS